MHARKEEPVGARAQRGEEEEGGEGERERGLFLTSG